MFQSSLLIENFNGIFYGYHYSNSLELGILLNTSVWKLMPILKTQDSVWCDKICVEICPV